MSAIPVCPLFHSYFINTVKPALIAIHLVFFFFPILACAQAGGDDRTYKAKDILPYLQPYDLGGLAKGVHPADELRTTGVKISFGSKWEPLPFTHFRVTINDVSFRFSDGRWFVFCPSEPPTMEQLSKARTLNEVMEMLAPAAKTSPHIRKFAMDVGTMTDNLNSKLSYRCDFHTAYLVRDRLMWITCTLYYSESDQPKTADTPIADSNIVISLSPVLE